METISMPMAGEAAFDQEKIDVAHIRIRHHSLQVAVLGAFREADRLLTAWAGSASEYVEFDFEVTFIDGYVFTGRYPFWRKSRSRPSLSKYVRRLFASLQPEAPAPGAAATGRGADLSRYLIDSF